MNNNLGELFIVASPIGNLEDISLRALKVLKSVNYILVEDSRKSSILLNHYNIKNKHLLACHQHSKESSFEKFYNLLLKGENLALMSDAGSPGINDPSNRFIEYIINKNKNIKIHPVPGSSALTALLSLVGKDINPFLYLGFLPHKKGKNKIFKMIAENRNFNIVFLDNPHRLLKNLEKLTEFLNDDPYIVIGREMTKIYESFYRDKLSNLLIELKAEKNFKGEIIIFISKK